MFRTQLIQKTYQNVNELNGFCWLGLSVLHGYNSVRKFIQIDVHTLGVGTNIVHIG